MGVSEIGAVEGQRNEIMSMNTITSYEAEFCRVVKARSARSFWKGRIALYAILKALEIGEGDEVLLPGFTCIVVANAVRLCGATPVYVDITKKRTIWILKVCCRTLLQEVVPLSFSTLLGFRQIWIH